MWCSKSPTTAWTSTGAYSFSIAAAAFRSVVSLTSNGTKRARRPRDASASSSRRVFSDVPEPSSTSVSAPATSAISPARATRIERSARVG